MHVGRVGGMIPRLLLISEIWLDTASCRDDRDGNGDASPPPCDAECVDETSEEEVDDDDDEDDDNGTGVPSNDDGSSDTSIVGR